SLNDSQRKARATSMLSALRCTHATVARLIGPGSEPGLWMDRRRECRALRGGSNGRGIFGDACANFPTDVRPFRAPVDNLLARLKMSKWLISCTERASGGNS